MDWTRFGAVLVNCAWDYQDRHEEFLATLDATAALGVPVFNDPATVRWNIRKTYLKEFEAKGREGDPDAVARGADGGGHCRGDAGVRRGRCGAEAAGGRRGAGAGALYAGEPAGAGTLLWFGRG
jgi:hypothetical protein